MAYDLRQTAANLKLFILDNKEALIIGLVVGAVIGVMVF